MPADDDGCRFGHHCRQRATNYIKIREVDRNKLITTLIYDSIWYYFVRDLAQHHGCVARRFDRDEPSTPPRWRGGRLGHHGRGVLPVFSCCGCLSHLSYVEKWYETPSVHRLTMLHCVPHWRAPHLPQVPTRQSAPITGACLPPSFRLPVLIPTLRRLLGPAIARVRIPS